MKLDALVGNDVRHLECGGARVVVIKFPRNHRVIAEYTAFHINNARRTKVRPREFFLTRPYQPDSLSRGFCQARSFNRGLTRVLTAIGRTRVGYDDTNLTCWDMTRLRQFCFDCEWPLRSRPDG